MRNLVTLWNSVERATSSDAAILNLMSKRMADLQRIHTLQEQLHQAEARARENEMKLREKDMGELMKQTEEDYFQLWSQLTKR